MSLKHLTIESFILRYSRLHSISPVAYKLWQVVSTLSSIFVSLANSSGFTSRCYDKNISFKSIAFSISYSSIMSKMPSSKPANKLTPPPPPLFDPYLPSSIIEAESSSSNCKSLSSDSVIYSFGVSSLRSSLISTESKSTSILSFCKLNCYYYNNFFYSAWTFFCLLVVCNWSISIGLRSKLFLALRSRGSGFR